MIKFFNNAGPQLPENYTLDPLRRIQFEHVHALVQQQRYFVLHAPRQTGKTTALYAMMRHYNAGTQYRAVYVNIEAGQAARNNVVQAMRGMGSSLVQAAKLHLKDPSLDAVFRDMVHNHKESDALQILIAHLSANDHAQPDNPRPLILFIDEIDALIGDTLISTLRQIRAGYNDRPHAFPISIILCGVRDVRDYRIHSAANAEIITGGSAFNIKAKSLTLGNFTKDEVAELYAQHTAETGQVFTAEALDLAWEYSYGQPWLVNVLAYSLTGDPFHKIPVTTVIDAEQMRRAKELLVLSRATHLDQLVDKLQEPRVYRVIAPLINSEDDASHEAKPDDVQYCSDLGLIRLDPASKTWQIANSIYRETIPRELTWVAQQMFGGSQPDLVWYKTADDTIDVPKLMRAFQQFYREHSEHWLKGMQYKEAGPQLLLQAYLQRVINGGGYIEREYGLGRGRTDLYIHYPVGANPKQREVIEIKVKRVKDSLESLVTKGTLQTREYMDRCGATLGHLIVFDPHSDKSWDERVYEKPLGADLMLWGC